MPFRAAMSLQREHKSGWPAWRWFWGHRAGFGARNPVQAGRGDHLGLAPSAFLKPLPWPL